jgi:hypothetical protein
MNAIERSEASEHNTIAGDSFLPSLDGCTTRKPSHLRRSNNIVFAIYAAEKATHLCDHVRCRPHMSALACCCLERGKSYHAFDLHPIVVVLGDCRQETRKKLAKQAKNVKDSHMIQANQ